VCDAGRGPIRVNLSAGDIERTRPCDQEGPPPASTVSPNRQIHGKWSTRHDAWKRRTRPRSIPTSARLGSRHANIETDPPPFFSGYPVQTIVMSLASAGSMRSGFTRTGVASRPGKK
jgi:hypothetical protein